MCISFEFLNPLISSEWFFFRHHFYKPAFAILYTPLSSTLYFCTATCVE